MERNYSMLKIEGREPLRMEFNRETMQAFESGINMETILQDSSQYHLILMYALRMHSRHLSARVAKEIWEQAVIDYEYADVLSIIIELYTSERNFVLQVGTGKKKKKLTIGLDRPAQTKTT